MGNTNFIKNEEARRKILFPAAIVIMAIMAVIGWKQCGYWKNSTTLFSHALRSTKDNYIAYDGLGIALLKEGKIEEAINHFKQAIHINSTHTNAYYNRGLSYLKLVNINLPFMIFNKSIKDYAPCYYHRGYAYAKIGKYQYAINNYNEAIRLKQDYTEAYNNRGGAYFKLQYNVPLMTILKPSV